MENQITGKRAVVITTHREATAAGIAALRRGGNAVDAAVAATMALCVISPTNVGLGGYGGSLIFYDAAVNRVRAIDYDSRAPLAYRAELYRDAKAAQRGYLSVGVPGVVAGLDLALKEFGKLDWRAASQHAIDLAENGFPVNTALAKDLANWARTADISSLLAIFPDGRHPNAGEPWVQRDLGALFRKLADVPRTFYTGEPARQIVRQVREHGGVLTEEDFARFKAQIVEPLHTNYRGYELWTPPPPSGGITTLGILKTLEQFSLAGYEPWDAPYLDLFCEASKLCWQERARWLGDPDVVNVPLGQMLSPKSAAERAQRIRRGDTNPQSGADIPAPPPGEHTVNVVCIDAHENMVSMTSTHGDTFGSHVAIAGTGLFLGHAMSRFDYRPNHPNAPAPGKRMHHNMSPLLVLRDAKPHAAIGMVGGPRLVTVTAQLVVSLIDFAATPAQVVQIPRVHIEAAEPIVTAPSVNESTAGLLEMMGHKVKRGPAQGGPANIALIDSGLMTAACGAGLDGVDGL
jgi:gamma-glutamyltranspeptidase/glutathione hydrolase